MLDFEFSLPTKIVFGKAAQKKLPELIKKGGFKKLLLVSYKKEIAESFPIYWEVRDILKDAGIPYAELLDCVPNPTLDDIRPGLEVARAENVDFILALGGGSVIDTAKAIALGVNTSLEDVWAYVIGTKDPDPAKTLKVGCILTAAAAGSETSTAVVLSDPVTGQKFGVHHEEKRPYFAIMNPEVTYTVPPFQTACGVFDSLMHAFERYFTDSVDTPLSDRVNEGIIKSIIEAGYTVMRDPHDYEARATLMWGASMAHNNLAGCGRKRGSGIHGIEDRLHIIAHNATHGAALSVVFPTWARQVYLRAVPRFAQFAVRVWGIEMNFEHPEETALRGIEAMESFIDYLGLPRKLSDLGITEEHFEQIVNACTVTGKSVSSLCEITEDDLWEILRRAK